MQSMQTLSRDILEAVFPNLPLLTSLHVINCGKIDQNAVLELLVHVSQLQSLAFTCYVSTALCCSFSTESYASPRILVALFQIPYLLCPHFDIYLLTSTAELHRRNTRRSSARICSCSCAHGHAPSSHSLSSYQRRSRSANPSSKIS